MVDAYDTWTSERMNRLAEQQSITFPDHAARDLSGQPMPERILGASRVITPTQNINFDGGIRNGNEAFDNLAWNVTLDGRTWHIDFARNYGGGPRFRLEASDRPDVQTFRDALTGNGVWFRQVDIANPENNIEYRLDDSVIANRTSSVWVFIISRQAAGHTPMVSGRQYRWELYIPEILHPIQKGRLSHNPKR